MVRSALKFASPGGSRGRLSILVLHRVLPSPDTLHPEAIDAVRFAEMCRWVSSMFTVLPLDQAVQCLRQRTLPERALAITFDDGYADNVRVAMPILKSLGLPATVFITTGFLDGGCMWNDVVIEAFRRTHASDIDLQDLLPALGTPRLGLSTPAERRHAIEAVIAAVKYFGVEQRLRVVHQIADRLHVDLPTDLMMTSAEVLELRGGGLQVGAHTVTHPILASLSIEDARREMKDSKDFLERLLGERVGLFAYPNGKPGKDFDERSMSLARELGFDAAVTTAPGAASHRTDPFQLPRFTPWDRARWRFGARMVGNLLVSHGPVPA